MACCVLQVTSLIFGGVGMVGTLATTVMPQWRVSAYFDGNIVVFETIWEGLWMDCISQLGIRLQCKFYDSVLALPPPLEAFRALMCIAVILSIISFLMAIVGVKYTHRTKEDPQDISIFILAAGVAFLLTGILVLIPVSWTGGSIIRDFYDPQVPMPLKRELGAALYVGWVSTALLITAGAMYCSFWCWADPSSKSRYPSLSRDRLHRPGFAGGLSLGNVIKWALCQSTVKRKISPFYENEERHENSSSQESLRESKQHVVGLEGRQLLYNSTTALP